jgi:hypothetical protein
MSELSLWEYRAETIGSTWSRLKDQDLEAVLNEWGEEGWEIINAFATSGSNKIKVIAKRPLSERGRRQRNWPSY